MISKSFTLRKEDVLKATKNAIVFAAPAILVLIGLFAKQVPQDASWAIVALWFLNFLTDLVKKYVQESKY